MEVTIGGDRLGAGKKIKQDLRTYNRSTFNQSQDWKSTMAPGVLYPFLCIPMTNGDVMNIKLEHFLRTLPTKGPLFGSYKLQVDVFSVPMRLYQGILHNNPIDIGLKMNQVYFPKLQLAYSSRAPKVAGTNKYTWQINNTSLLKYLGLSGIGTSNSQITRKINATPALAYYDIFKNYYANKQEETAFVIGYDRATAITVVDGINWNGAENFDNPTDNIYEFALTAGGRRETAILTGQALEPNNIDLSILDEDGFEVEILQLSSYIDKGLLNVTTNSDGTKLTIDFYPYNIRAQYPGAKKWRISASQSVEGIISSNIALEEFPLKNIDKMRQAILSENELGSEFRIGTNNEPASVHTPDKQWSETSGVNPELYHGKPYTNLVHIEPTDASGGLAGVNSNSFPMNGLVVKTYQSDLFQNWIDTEWIEGDNGIAALSAVNVSDGTLEMDALNLAEKVYNMLNRIAINGGTWENYQEAVWSEDAVKKAEQPMYEGGMSAEIMFEEVVSTSETNVENDFQALGSLGGKGKTYGQNGGGDIEIHAREPLFVMGIVSITPRICYTQGNEWYLTELDSIDDLHKPALDGIGYQDLIIEQFAWWDTIYNATTKRMTRNSAGKVVAWSNYMTAVDKAFGDFAEPEGKGFMVLARNYEMEELEGGTTIVKDVTTYIDPAKFNYAFAYTDLASQNFWVQIHSTITTRRVMSAHQIPNL